ncbi:MAG: DUF5615 family PIN-like protein [Anaerolineae bacterium]
MDHHVSAAITDGLRKRGVDVLTAHEDGAARFDDDTLLSRATELGRVLFSQDRDLLVIAHARLETGVEFAGLIYAHQLNITVGRAVRDLEMLATLLDTADLRNQIEFIPL